MYISGKTLTHDSYSQVLREATTFGDEWLECEIRGKREHEIALLTAGSQAVPTTEPGWVYNMANWDQNHFARYILEGLK